MNAPGMTMELRSLSLYSLFSSRVILIMYVLWGTRVDTCAPVNLEYILKETHPWRPPSGKHPPLRYTRYTVVKHPDLYRQQQQPQAVGVGAGVVGVSAGEE